MPAIVVSDGRSLAYREEGSGPPLVLVHGSPGDSRSWGRVAPFLKHRFRLVMVDLPGYGASDAVPDQPTGRAALMGTAVARLAESCGQPVGLAAHSYGGVVALQAALQAKSGTVARLTLFEPVFVRGLELAGDAILGSVTAHFDDYVGRVAKGEDGAVQRMVDFWFGSGAYQRMPEPVRGYLNANAGRNALDVRSSFSDTATVDQLAALDQPVLVAYGDKSPEVVRAIGRAVVKLLPNARMEAIAGANHAMLDFHSEAVARLIAE
jgi:pimeloyl-ACP methyl ester carboxylesterase